MNDGTWIGDEPYYYMHGSGAIPEWSDPDDSAEWQLDPSQVNLAQMVDLTTSDDGGAAETPEEPVLPVTLNDAGISQVVGNRAYGFDWLFTWNNYPDDVEERMALWETKYLVYQFEVGANGTPHVQGFVQFTKRKRLTGLKRLCAEIHWEQRRGTVQQCVDYCTKTRTRVRVGKSVGVASFSGQRTDLAELALSLVSGKKRMRDLVLENPVVGLRYSKGLQFLEQFAPAPEIEREVDVWLYLGTTGSGKTWSATHTPGYNGNDVYMKDTSKWFDHYVGQRLVVMDDFSGAASHIPLNELLRLLDSYRYQVEVKGGYRWLMAELVIVTTNIHPIKWYKYEEREEQYSALMRRFKKIVLFRSRTDVHEVSGEDELKRFIAGEGYERHPQQG